MLNFLRSVGLCLYGLFFLLALLAIHLVREAAKIFVWAVMLAGISFSKIVLLCKIWRAHSLLLDFEDAYDCCSSAEEGVLHKKLEALRGECERLKIAGWRQGVAYWLAKY